MRVSHLLLTCTLLRAPLARGDPWQYELLLLPSAQAVGTFNREAPVTEIVDEVVQLDTLFTVQKGPFKLFGEYLVSDHEHDLERYARTASYAQVTETLYDRSRFRHRNYLRHLRPVTPILLPAIERLGYPTADA